MKTEIIDGGKTHNAIPRVITAADVLRDYQPSKYPIVKVQTDRLLVTVHAGVTYECGLSPFKFIALVHHLSAKNWATRTFIYHLTQRTLKATGWKCHPFQPEF